MIVDIETEFNRRFFQALNILEISGKIQSLSGYIKDIGAAASRYRTMRQQFIYDNTLEYVHYRRVEFRVIYETVKRFNLSLDWLYFGTGEMFKKVA